jgi:hypothetical protein
VALVAVELETSTDARATTAARASIALVPGASPKRLFSHMEMPATRHGIRLRS